MPTINLSFDISQERANFLKEWFAEWNAGLDTPYDTYQDFLIDIIKRKLKAVLQKYYTLSADEIKDADLTIDQINRIRAIINE